MINKKGLWFLTLFSLILVLSVYYITMPDEMFKNDDINKVETVSKEETSTNKTVVEELSTLEVLKQELNDEREKLLDSLEQQLSSTSTTKEEKNTAYESIKEINSSKSIENSIEEKIKNKLELDSFVKKENNQVVVVISKKDHNIELANEIMQLVQKEFNKEMNVSVKFQA